MSEREFKVGDKVVLKNPDKCHKNNYGAHLFSFMIPDKKDKIGEIIEIRKEFKACRIRFKSIKSHFIYDFDWIEHVNDSKSDLSDKIDEKDSAKIGRWEKRFQKLHGDLTC